MGMSDPFIIPEISPHISNEINKLKNGSKVAWLGQIHPLSLSADTMYKAIMDNVKIEINSDFYDLYNDEKVADNSHVWDVNSEWDFAEYDLIVAVRIFYACTSASQLIRNLKKVASSDQKIIGDLMSGNNKNFEDVKIEDLNSYLDNCSPEVQSEAQTLSLHFGDDTLVRVYSNSSVVIDGQLCEVFSKPEGSKAIMPMLTTIWKDSGIKSVTLIRSQEGENYTGPINFIAKPNFEDQVLEEKDFSEKGVGLKNIHTFRDSIKNRIYSVCEFVDES